MPLGEHDKRSRAECHLLQEVYRATLVIDKLPDKCYDRKEKETKTGRSKHMHYEKFKGKADVRRLLEHSDRGQTGVADHKHSNKQIDPECSHLNYELKDRGGLSAVEYHRKRIEQIAEETKQRTGKSLRKDAVTLCSWVVTAPQDLPEDKQAKFFQKAYEWFSERYGEDNIVTAAVHLDETSPHLHLQFTPIIEDKNGTRRLCAKDLETRKTLQTVHQKLEKYLTQELGCKVTLLNGATDNGNKTITELKIATLQVQVKELSNQLAELRTARADEVSRIGKMFQGVAEKVKLGHKLNSSEMQTLERTAQVVGELQKIQAEVEQAKNIAENHEKALQEHEKVLQERKQHFDEEVHAKAQELSESVVVRSQRTINEVKRQTSTEIDKIQQERDKVVKQKAVIQEQLRQERERLEQALEIATRYAYLVNEIGVPNQWQQFDDECWQQLQALREPQEEQKQIQKNYGIDW